MEEEQIQRIVEAALLASDGPLTVANLVKLFTAGELDEENASKQIRDALKVLQEDAKTRGVELKRVASGYRYQVRQDLSQWVSRLWDEKPPRYTRALLETLALIAYKQPVTRGDIEQVRGVGVSQNIMRTLLERDWIRVVGQKEVPGRPSLYGTTKGFLDYFSLKSLDELPPLAEIRALIEPTLVVENEPTPVAGVTLELPPEDLEDANAVAAHVEMPGDGDGEEQGAESADVESTDAGASGEDTGASETDGEQDAAVESAAEATPSDAAEPSADVEPSAGVEPSADVVQLHSSSAQNNS